MFVGLWTRMKTAWINHRRHEDTHTHTHTQNQTVIASHFDWSKVFDGVQRRFRYSCSCRISTGLGASILMGASVLQCNTLFCLQKQNVRIIVLVFLEQMAYWNHREFREWFECHTPIETPWITTLSLTRDCLVMYIIALVFHDSPSLLPSMLSISLVLHHHHPFFLHLAQKSQKCSSKFPRSRRLRSASKLWRTLKPLSAPSLSCALVS